MKRRVRYTIRFSLFIVTAVAILFAGAVARIRWFERIGQDVETILFEGAVVDLRREEDSYLAKYAEGFEGYPYYIRKYSGTGELSDVDAFLDLIERNPSVEKLIIEGSELSDDQVARMLSLPLDSLGIEQCRTGGTLRATASPTIEWLQFARTRLDDHSLKALGVMPNVKFLDLTRTRVSDRSIDYLASLPSLEALSIRRCKITREGRDRFLKLRPDVDVGWEELIR